jgi:hypothetical protein
VTPPASFLYALAMTNPLSSLSLDQLKQAVLLREQIAALENELAGILSGGVPTPAPTTISAVLPRRRGRPPGKPASVVPAGPSEEPVTVHSGPRNFSAASRAKMAAAQKARWAKVRKAKGMKR